MTYRPNRRRMIYALPSEMKSDRWLFDSILNNWFVMQWKFYLQSMGIDPVITDDIFKITTLNFIADNLYSFEIWKLLLSACTIIFCTKYIPITTASEFEMSNELITDIVWYYCYKKSLRDVVGQRSSLYIHVYWNIWEAWSEWYK